MKQYAIAYTPEAQQDQIDIFEWIAKGTSQAIATRFLRNLLVECRSLQLAPRRGTARTWRNEKVRTFGYRRRVRIVFSVTNDTVTNDTVIILRLLYGGRNATTLLGK